MVIFTEISGKEAVSFLLPKHYSGRKPSISYAFGVIKGEVLQAVCTFGKPASNNLCVGICGKENAKYVYELNRLCRLDECNVPMSQFVSFCLRELSKHDKIIVSYADTAMNHCGYIYQACNFLYTGKTQSRTDKYTEGNKHSRHYDKNSDVSVRKVRSAKHRYVFFCTRNKKLRKLWRESLKYQIVDFPKEQNKNYVLGDFLKPEIVGKNE